ncbi:MAG TPA: DNA alkylation repair protein [Longimicrobium sp.]|nr:DNA alkylation repair protein [Longimicrobium sp.]
MPDPSPVDVAEIVSEIRGELRALESPATAEIREVRRGFSRRLAAASAAEVVAVALALVDVPGFAHRFVGYELIAYHRAALASLGKTELESLARGMDSWEKVDTFGCYLAGPAWREGQVADDVVHAWARSPDRWLRRAALVCTVALNIRARGGRGDAARTLAVCRMLLHDRDDMVVKAMSWALRALATRHPAAAADFLARHRGELAPRVIRELTNKLQTGLKNPRSR